MAHRTGPFLFIFIYPLLPWIGVMLTGFGAAGLFEASPDRRHSNLLGPGLMLTAAFVLLRALDVTTHRSLSVPARPSLRPDQK
jgi:uncharacterized membrane protein